MAGRRRCQEPWRGLLGAHALCYSAENRFCAVWGPCTLRQSAPCGGHPCHQRSCQRASHKQVSERCRHRSAAGMLADVIRPRVPVPGGAGTPRHPACRTKFAKRECAGACESYCPRPPAMPAPRAPAHWAAALLGLASRPAQVGAAYSEATGALLLCRTAAVAGCAADAAAMGASRPHLWRGKASAFCGCLQKELFPEPRLPPRLATGMR